ncbi:MAG: BamA/TamA family outer membrane protein [Acidobacteria bacterium]|nr:BamA/TamA family outer membrane protein [Acidobacteriota bacterium]
MQLRVPRCGRAAQALAILFLASAAAAQEGAEPSTRAEKILEERKEKAAGAKPEEPTGIERKLLALKDHQVLQRFGSVSEGVFPKLGGLATGQGFALGAQYFKKGLAGGRVDFFTSGVVSTSRSQKYDLRISAPRLADGRLELDFLAEQRNLARVDFYGLGPETLLADRTSFRLEDTSFTGTVAYKPFGRYLRMGLTGGSLNVNTGPGGRTEFPSTEQLFSPAAVPGLADQTSFVRGGPFVELDLRDNPRGPRAGSYLAAKLNYFDDRQLGRHDFRQLELEGQQYLPFFNKKRVIVLRARSLFSYADGDQSVPFYLKPWIGGPGELRGFRNYRFYDDNVLVMNAEYRWEAFSGLDMALFFDAGQVAPQRRLFQLQQMQTNAGFGFRFNIRNATFLRLDFAFSHEGMRMWFRFGNPF